MLGQWGVTWTLLCPEIIQKSLLILDTITDLYPDVVYE